MVNGTINDDNKLKDRDKYNADDFDAPVAVMARTCRNSNSRLASSTLSAGRMRDAKLSFRTSYEDDIGMHKLRE